MNCRIIDIHTHIYPVALKYHGQLQETYGLYDTGNRLCDTVTGAPVSVADPEILRSLLSEELREPAGGIETTESGGGEPVREGSGKKKYYLIRRPSPGL